MKETEKYQLEGKCNHKYKMNGDLGLIKICCKCGTYIIKTTNKKTDEKR